MPLARLACLQAGQNFRVQKLEFHNIFTQFYGNPNNHRNKTSTLLKQTIEKSICKDCGGAWGKNPDKIENSILKIEFSNIFQSNMH